MKTFPMIKYMLPVALLLATTSAHAAVNVEVKMPTKPCCKLTPTTAKANYSNRGQPFHQ